MLKYKKQVKRTRLNSDIHFYVLTMFYERVHTFGSFNIHTYKYSISFLFDRLPTDMSRIHTFK
jgi:hypothetical protein